MDLSLLDTLKYKLIFGKEFSDIFNYFFDHFGEDSEFFDVSVPTRDEKLETILALVGGQILKKKTVLPLEMRAMLVPDYDFIHGNFIMERGMGVFIYFTDIEKGLLGMTLAASPTHTQYCRFSAEMLDKNPPPPTPFKN